MLLISFWNYNIECFFQINPQDNFHLHANIKIDESKTYDQHERLIYAESACDNAEQCIGIYDASCDGEGPFLLLPRGYVTSVSSANCMYKKKTYNRMQVFLDNEGID